MYSQNGEDTFIGEYLVQKQIYVEPMFVDVGAGDGEYLSNSKEIIELYDYKGLMIEMNSTVFRKLKALYSENKKVVCINEAIAATEYSYLMTNESHWSLNKVRKNKSKGAKMTKKLSKILKEQKIKRIGILSLDIEGLETEVLAELLQNTDIQPEVIIIEANNEKEASIQRDLLSGSYDLIKRMGVNQIFILRSINK